MLTMKDWPKIEKAYEDAIAEVRRKKGTPDRMRDVMGDYGIDNRPGEVILPFSQVWESFMPKLEYRHVLGSKHYSCPHTEGGEVERVLIMFNESDSTGICLDCLMEWVERNRSRIWGCGE